MTTISPLPWQAQTLALRTHLDLIILAGGRGGGKSTCARFHLLGHCADLLEHAAPVVVRENFQPLHEFMGETYTMAHAAFGSRGLSYNKSDSVITLPTRGSIYGMSLHDGEAAALRMQGRNLTGCFSEEVGVYKSHQFALMRRLESNLRPPKQFKAERVWTGNPGGVGSSIVYRNWLSKTPPMKAARDHHGLSFAWMPSVYTDNTYLDHRAYKRNLTASVGSDAILAQAWLEGRWGIVGGLMFHLDPEVHIIRPPPAWLLKRSGKFFAASDWGSSSPATFLLGCVLKESINWDGRRLPYGSVIIVEETDTAADENDLTVGTGLDARSFADQCRDVLIKWDAVKCDVIVDDQKGVLGDSVVDYFKSAGLRAEKPDKTSRVEGWDIIRQYLSEAQHQRGVPGLYFTTLCPHLIQTAAEAPRATLNPRDLDPRWNLDHWVDALAYEMKQVAGGPKSAQTPVVGMY